MTYTRTSLHSACDRLGVEPAQAAHVGDHHYADVTGATAAGMTAVLIDRHGTACEQPDLFLNTLDDIEAVLGMEEGA